MAIHIPVNNHVGGGIPKTQRNGMRQIQKAPVIANEGFANFLVVRRRLVSNQPSKLLSNAEYQ